MAAIDAPAVALSALMGLDLRQSIRESDDLFFITSVARSVGSRRRAMPTRTLCPKCHGQRATYCRVCRGTGKKSVAGISVGNCNTCAEVVAAAAMFVVARAKLNRQTKRQQLPRITVLLETHDPFGNPRFPRVQTPVELKGQASKEGGIGYVFCQSRQCVGCTSVRSLPSALTHPPRMRWHGNTRACIPS